MKLICTYEEWLERKDRKDGLSLSADMAKSLSLAMKFDKTEEEQKEFEELMRSNEQNIADEKFTNLTHTITHLCINPQSSDIDFEKIGRMQFDLERMKYPVVVPKKEE